MYLSCLVAPNDREIRRDDDWLSSFHVNRAVGGKPRGALPEKFGPSRLAKRGIQKDDIEQAPFMREKRIGIGATRFQPIGAKGSPGGDDCAHQQRIAVDGYGEGRATRQSLERKRTAAAEQFER